MLAKQLTEDEQDEFIEAFYEACDFDLDDLDCPNPWGCPWFWAPNQELKGDSIKEMAINFYQEYKQEIADAFNVEMDE